MIQKKIDMPIILLIEHLTIVPIIFVQRRKNGKVFYPLTSFASFLHKIFTIYVQFTSNSHFNISLKFEFVNMLGDKPSK